MTVVEEYLKEIREILALPTVMDIVINKPCEVWAITTDKGWVRYEYERLTFSYLESLTNLIANGSKKNITRDNPILSAKLPNTEERVQIVIPPAVPEGEISITIRKASPVTFTLEELNEQGSFNSLIKREARKHPKEVLLPLLDQGNIVQFLTKAVELKQNIIVSGATGSGKTTFMKSLIQKIPSDERLITIEDVPELDLKSHPNRVHLLYSRDNEEGFNVTAKEALASCLRMRPSRILLAELRGDEAWEYIKSINTGHQGSITSMHANSAFESFEQLTAFIKDSTTGSHLNADYIQNRLFSTIDIILFFSDRVLKDVYYEPTRKEAYLNGVGKEYSDNKGDSIQ